MTRVLGRRRRVIGVAILSLVVGLAALADVVGSAEPDTPTKEGHLSEHVRPTAAEGSLRGEDEHVHIPTAASPHALTPSSVDHWLGTDERGRDVLAMVARGTRRSLAAGALVAFVGAIGGAVAGAVAGYWAPRHGRRLELVAQSIDALPALLVVAIIVEGLRVSTSIAVVVGAALAQWATTARLVRSEVQRLAAEDFVLASRALGATRRQVLARHLAPHVGPAIFSSAAFGLSSVVVLETSLAFLELGPPIREPSWGELLAQGARHPERLPLLVVPSVLLVATVGAAYLLVDAYRDRHDPALRALRRSAPTSPS